MPTHLKRIYGRLDFFAGVLDHLAGLCLKLCCNLIPLGLGCGKWEALA